MATSLNRWTGIGNLGSDPECRSTPGGQQVANFRIACSETWKDGNGVKQERTEWVNIVAWRKLADVASKWLKKGMQVYVEGKLQTRTWEDKAGGGKRYATEILADEIKMLGGKPEGERSPRAASEERDGSGYDPSFTPNPADDEESLPF